MVVFAAMQERRSARAYLAKPIARADIEDIFKYEGCRSLQYLVAQLGQ
jgi:hypothetical protein